MAHQNRCAACRRRSELASSGNSIESGAPLAGIADRKSRCFEPARTTTPCQPSGPRRNSPSPSLVKSRACPASLAAPNCRSDKTVERVSGAQNIDCWSNACSGSAAKRQPPFFSELVRCPAGLRGRCQIFELSLVFAITAEPFPGDVGYFCLFEVCVILLRSPINNHHGYFPTVQTMKTCNTTM